MNNYKEINKRYGDNIVHKLRLKLRVMIDRCHNPNTRQYMNYGGRGITVCNEWRKDAKKFIVWSINNGYDGKLTIDRIDNNLGYSQSNCRYVTHLVQNNNARFNLPVKYKGEKMTLSEFCREYKVDYKWANNLYHKCITNIDFLDAVFKGKVDSSFKIVGIEINGKVYKNLRAVEKEFNISYRNLRTRWSRGKRGLKLIEPVRKRN